MYLNAKGVVILFVTKLLQMLWQILDIKCVLMTKFGQIVCTILTKIVSERCDHVVHVLMKKVWSYCVSLNDLIVFIVMTKVPSYCLCLNDKSW